MTNYIRFLEKKIFSLKEELDKEIHLLPDHHNEFGKAWWTGDIPISNIKCIFSGD